MSKASEIIVLCEDKSHEVFVRRFLRSGWKVPIYKFRFRPYPREKGSGKKFVEDKIGEEAKALRTRHASTILLIVRDADEDSVKEATRILDSKFQPPRTEKEQIIYVIPKWSIETWAAYLDGVDVDESEQKEYKNEYRTICESKKGHQLVDKLANNCKNGEELESPPDSLVAACKEFERIRGALAGD
ncbi:hypothetical protein K9N50_00135 [bacterium]|nr:hypothetical protein [bacterium]